MIPGGPLGGSRGDDDGAGTGGAPNGSEDKLALRAYDELFALLTKDYAASGTIYLESAGGEWEPVSYSGRPVSFTATEEPLWGAFDPRDSSSVVLTLSQISGAAPTLGVMPRLAIDTIFQQLTIPAEPDPERAQVLVRIADRGGNPLPQVVPAVPGARTIVYASLGSWLESSDQTSNEGMFLAADVPAATFPGSKLTINLSGAAQGTFEVPVAAGAVTVFGVTVD